MKANSWMLRWRSASGNSIDSTRDWPATAATAARPAQGRARRCGRSPRRSRIVASRLAVLRRSSPGCTRTLVTRPCRGLGRGSCVRPAVARPEQVDAAVASAKSVLTGSSNEATARRRIPKTSKNSFQNVCFSAISLVAVCPIFSRSRWRSDGFRSRKWACCLPGYTLA